jgi:pullulanase-type alpha-1,6-glucosidase
VERSTCCDNTATEHRMMGRLLVDSVVLWAQAYGMSSFRFDLMGHQPRDVMERLQARLRQTLGHEVPLIGEGWNFGEVADGARFVQASQRSLNGTGIGTFSDRGRDAVRGGAAGDDAAASRAHPGFIVAATAGDGTRQAEWLRQADLLRLALAGTLGSYRFENVDGVTRSGAEMPYGDQPAGYASMPGETVNYVENHDNQTLFDALVLKLPASTTPEDRARVQILALGINALSQGVAYFHAGGELLRSKSMDRNSYDSGDWFNALDWRGQDNGFGRGLPPKADNGGDYALLRPLLADARIKPSPAVIDWTHRAFLDLLRIRASTPLLRLSSAQEVQQRLQFYNTGPGQRAGLVVGRLDGAGRPDAGVDRLLYLINARDEAAEVTVPQEAGRAWRLHPVQASASAADRVVAEQATVAVDTGRFSVPARSVAVFVVERLDAR